MSFLNSQISGSRWRVKNISYRISKYPTKKKLSKEDVDAEIKKALEVWSEFTGLKFEERSSGQVHIDIRLGSSKFIVIMKFVFNNPLYPLRSFV